MSNLPKLQDLYSENLQALEKQNYLNAFLNAEPKKEWIKKHPLAKEVKYIPIERIEFLLTYIFVEWKVEILREGLIANSVYCAVRLHYKDPVGGEWKWQDGVGAAPLQTDKGAAATDWEKIKNDAVMKALPAAESFAVKDAAEKLGKLFGKDLNRADKIMYDALSKKFSGGLEEKLKEAIALIDKLPKDEKESYKSMLRAKKQSGELTVDLVEDIINEVRNENL